MQQRGSAQKNDTQTPWNPMKVRKRQMVAERESARQTQMKKKEQVYSTEIAGHSVNLALYSHSRRRIKGRRRGEGKRRSSVVFLTGPTSQESVSITKSCEIVRQFSQTPRLPVIFVVPLWCPFTLWFYSFFFFFSPFFSLSSRFSLILPHDFHFSLFSTSFSLTLSFSPSLPCFSLLAQLNKKKTYLLFVRVRVNTGKLEKRKARATGLQGFGTWIFMFRFTFTYSHQMIICQRFPRTIANCSKIL